jgi:hypothetical protein
LGQRAAKIGLKLGDDRRQRLGGDFVLQAGQFAGDFRGQNIHPDAEKLAQFNEHAAHIHRQRPVAPGDLLPARQGIGAETAQAGAIEDNIPPENVQKGAGKKAAHFAVAPGIDFGGGRRLAGLGAAGLAEVPVQLLLDFFRGALGIDGHRWLCFRLGWGDYSRFCRGQKSYIDGGVVVYWVGVIPGGVLRFGGVH